jgi:hypothetical protein
MKSLSAFSGFCPRDLVARPAQAAPNPRPSGGPRLPQTCNSLKNYPKAPKIGKKYGGNTQENTDVTDVTVPGRGPAALSGSVGVNHQRWLPWRAVQVKGWFVAVPQIEH